jgi:hypothetical protein
MQDSVSALDAPLPWCIVILVSSTLLDGHRGSAVSVVGLLVWVVALATLPAPLAARILLLAPLVIVPRLLALLPERAWVARIAGTPALAAAVPLIVAFGLPSGPLAGAFVLPWLALALVSVLAAVRHGLAKLPAILLPRAWAELGIDVALGFWAVGVVFLLLDRLGVATGYAPVIVLLTATHFHVAGLGLLGLASLLARSRPWLRLPVAGLIVGIPVTALGFVLVSDAIDAVGALLVGLSGIGVGVGLLTVTSAGIARWASRAAGIALLVGMPMGILWSLSILTGRTFLDLDTMIRTHGALNATAVLLSVMTYPPEAP